MHCTTTPIRHDSSVTVPAKGYRFVGEIQVASAGRDREFRAPPQRAIVGRERELTTLLSGLDEAASGRGSLFLISGEAGVARRGSRTKLRLRLRRRG